MVTQYVEDYEELTGLTRGTPDSEVSPAVVDTKVITAPPAADTAATTTAEVK